MPASMTCIEIPTPGGPDALVTGKRQPPEPSAGEVLIRVCAAGVNRPDVIQRQGKYPPPPGASDIPGLEVAGIVEAAGDGVTEWKPGDRVCALLTGGGYADYAVTPGAMCLPVPKGLSMTEAAALPETFFTVWHNAFERGDLKPGETFLVHGGSSGIGTTAIQLGKAFGATVYTTAGSREKCEACEKLGADRAVNYREEDYVEVLKGISDGVDVILDMVGGDYIGRDLKLLKTEGRRVSIAFLNGSRSEIDFMPVMLKRLTLTGSTLRAQPTGNKGRIAKALREQVWPLIEQGHIRPLIHSTFPLAEAAEAHRLMESSTHIGKIVLTISEEE